MTPAVEASPASISPNWREARVVIRLATPVVLTQVATMTMGVVDTMMVARLGTEALAATTLGAVWAFGTLVLAMGILFGLDPIVTQAHGSGDGERAGRALQQALVLCVALSVPIALLWLVTGPVLVAARQDPGLAAIAHRYTVVQIFSIAPFLAYTALRQYLTGRTIMAPAMWVVWVANGVNVVLNWALIFGHLGMPALGVVGAGIATGLSRLFMFAALVAWVVVADLHRGAWPAWSRAAVDRGGLREILRHGLPVGAQIGFEVWGFHLVTFFAGRIGAVAVAAHAIVLQIASLSFMVPFGLSMAAATRVGNLIGAGDEAGARRAGWVSLVLGASTMACFAAIFVLLREILPRAWAPEPEVFALAVAILPIAAAFQVFDGTQVVGCGVLRGRGDTRPAAWFNLIGYYALGLPTGYVLAFRLGAGLPGLWWGLTIGLMTVAFLLVWRIRGPRPAPTTPDV